jgi:prepilin-type N-terminal cleavage/methylation domain-containing protein
VTIARHLRRSGTTLVELLAVLAVIAILVSVASLAPRAVAKIDQDDPYVRIDSARAAALRTASPRTLTLEFGGALRSVSILPDGRILADTSFHIDPHTGRRELHAP